MSVKLRTKKLSDGSESFYLDIYVKGSRSYEFLDIKIKKNDSERKQKKELAEAKRSKRELEIISDYHDLPKNFNGDEDFLEYFESNTKDYTYVSVYNDFKRFVDNRTINGKLPFKMLSEKIIDDYREHLEKSIKNSSAWAYLAKLKTILNKAIKEKLIVKSPAKFVRIKLEDIDIPFLTEKEVRDMINTEAPNIELKKAFIFSCFTALRISDVKKLTWSEIKEGRLYFRQKKTRGIEYFTLPETALNFLYLNVNKSEIEGNKLVFNLYDKRLMNKELSLWATNAGINRHITYHVSRHTFPTLALSCGVDIYTVSKIMGHKSVKMTEVYARIINKTVEEAIKRLPAIEVNKKDIQYKEINKKAV